MPKKLKTEETKKVTKKVKPKLKRARKSGVRRKFERPKMPLRPKKESKFWRSVDPYCSTVSRDDVAFLDDLIEECNQEVIMNIPEIGPHCADEKNSKIKEELIGVSTPDDSDESNISLDSYMNSVIYLMASTILEEENGIEIPEVQDKHIDMSIKPSNNHGVLNSELKNLGLLDDAEDDTKVKDDENGNEIPEVKDKPNDMSIKPSTNRGVLNSELMNLGLLDDAEDDTKLKDEENGNEIPEVQDKPNDISIKPSNNRGVLNSELMNLGLLDDAEDDTKLKDEENGNEIPEVQDKPNDISIKPSNNHGVLNSELMNLGLLDDAEDDTKAKDDEIFREIKRYQQELLALNEHNRRELNRLRNSVINKDFTQQEVVKKLEQVDHKVEKVYNQLSSATRADKNQIEREALPEEALQK